MRPLAPSLMTSNLQTCRPLRSTPCFNSHFIRTVCCFFPTSTAPALVGFSPMSFRVVLSLISCCLLCSVCVSAGSAAFGFVSVILQHTHHQLCNPLFDRCTMLLLSHQLINRKLSWITSSKFVLSFVTHKLRAHFSWMKRKHLATDDEAVLPVFTSMFRQVHIMKIFVPWVSLILLHIVLKKLAHRWGAFSGLFSVCITTESCTESAALN